MEEALNTDSPDNLLIRQALSGVANAFETLMRRYETHVGRLMWRFVHDTNAHAELVHEVFVQVYFGLSGYRGDAPFIHWLSAVASRTGLRWWKKQSANNRFRPLPDEIADSRPAEQTGRKIPELPPGGLFAMLSELPDNDRAALTLMYFEKKNAKEIAEILGWTHTAARMRISRARRKLQGIVKKHGYLMEE